MFEKGLEILCWRWKCRLFGTVDSCFEPPIPHKMEVLQAEWGNYCPIGEKNSSEWEGGGWMPVHWPMRRLNFMAATRGEGSGISPLVTSWMTVINVDWSQVPGLRNPQTFIKIFHSNTWCWSLSVTFCFKPFYPKLISSTLASKRKAFLLWTFYGMLYPETINQRSMSALLVWSSGCKNAVGILDLG